MPIDMSNLPWLQSQYAYLVGQLRLRDPGFKTPYTDDEVIALSETQLARVVTDLRKLALVPPTR